MRALLHTEFAALLARADVSQAAFARISGYTPRQVNDWARGRAATPLWAGALAAVLQQTVVPVNVVWNRGVAEGGVGTISPAGLPACTAAADGADDCAATVDVAVQPCAFGAPLRGCGA